MFSGNVFAAKERQLAEKWTSPRPPRNGYSGASPRLLRPARLRYCAEVIIGVRLVNST
jgi:hypothetical protein